MINIKKLTLLVLLIILFSIPTVAAFEDNLSRINSTVEDSNSDISSIYTENEQIDFKTSDEIDLSSIQDGNFNELKSKISSTNSNGVLNLDKNYKYDSSDGDISIELSKPITINGNGHTIDGNSKTGLFKITANNVILNDIKFINGIGVEDEGNPHGGAICWKGNIGTINNCIFINNTVRNDGGAVYFSGTLYNVRNSTFMKNDALNGGAIKGTNSLVVSDCNFIENKASGYGEGNGGAIYMVFVVNKCNFTNNYGGKYGGAIRTYNTQAIISNCYFSNNTSQYEGGALVSIGTIINSTFINNEAIEFKGGAISAKGALTIKKCNFNFNKAHSGMAEDIYYLNPVGAVDFYSIYANNYIVKVEECSFNRASTSINISNITSKPDENNKIIAILTDANNYALANKKITIKFEKNNEIKIFNINTDDNGTGTINYKLYNLTEGIWNLNIFFDGDNDYEPCLTNSKINIKIETSHSSSNNSFENEKKIKELEENVDNLTEQLKSSNNKIKELQQNIDYLSEQIKLNNELIQLLNKNLSNIADNSNNSPSTIKENENNNSPIVSSPKIIKITPKISAKLKTFKKSVKIKKYSIKLININKAVKNVKVSLKINGKTYKVTTNSKGIATFKISKLNKKGTFKGVITFNGDKYYNKVTKNVKIKCK